LDPTVDVETISASLADGVLTITTTESEKPGPVKIPLTNNAPEIAYESEPAEGSSAETGDNEIKVSGDSD
jgi:hypothetical protein